MAEPIDYEHIFKPPWSEAQQLLIDQIEEAIDPRATIFNNKKTGYFPLDLSPAAAEEIDPRVLRTYLDEITRIGKKFPATMGGLVAVSPTNAYGSFGQALINPKTGKFMGSAAGQQPLWRLGVPTGRSVEGLRGSLLGEYARDWLAGGGTTEGGRFAPALNPLKGTASHEAMHAIDRSALEWIEKNAKKAGDAGEYYRQVRAKLAAQALESRPTILQLPEYARDSARRSFQSQAEVLSAPYNRNTTEAVATRALQDAIKNKEGVTRGHIEALKPWQQELIPIEAVAEAGGPTLAGVTDTPLAGVTPNARTRVALNYGDELINYALPKLQKAGWKPLVDTLEKGNLAKTVAKGLPLMGAGIAAEYGAGQLPKGLIRELALGATRGAGYGSILGAPGMVAGAGLGALVSQLGIKRPKTGTPLDWL